MGVVFGFWFGSRERGRVDAAELEDEEEETIEGA